MRKREREREREMCNNTGHEEHKIIMEMILIRYDNEMKLQKKTQDPGKLELAW